MQNKFLTTTKAAELLGCSGTTVREMLDRGILTSIKTPGGHRRALAEEVQEYLRKQIEK